MIADLICKDWNSPGCTHLYFSVPGLFHRLPSSSAVFRRLPACSGVFRRFPVSSDVFRRLPLFSVVFRRIYGHQDWNASHTHPVVQRQVNKSSGTSAADRESWAEWEQSDASPPGARHTGSGHLSQMNSYSAAPAAAPAAVLRGSTRGRGPPETSASSGIPQRDPKRKFDGDGARHGDGGGSGEGDDVVSVQYSKAHPGVLGNNFGTGGGGAVAEGGLGVGSRSRRKRSAGFDGLRQMDIASSFKAGEQQRARAESARSRQDQSDPGPVGP